MTDLMADFHERAEQAHAESVARGEHDEQCEYCVIPRWYLCNCSRRRREAKGLTTVPELEFAPPNCLGCNEETEVDADGFTCERCCCSWDFQGGENGFYDDFGDLWAEIEAHRAKQTNGDPAQAPAIVTVDLPEVVDP